MEEKQKSMPVPKGTDAMIGTDQCTWGYVVKASQKRLIGMRMAPHMPITRRLSGGGWPLYLIRWRCRNLYAGKYQ
jgi:hypothetical protein